MKKRLFIINLNKEDGFLFIYMTFLLTILMLVTITSIAIYISNQQLTINQLEQIELETLHQMAYREFTLEQTAENRTYSYPNGFVTITINQINENKLTCTFIAYTIGGHQKNRSYIISLVGDIRKVTK